MISKNDCLLLLYDISNKGIDTEEMLNLLLGSPTIPLEVIKFINDNRQFDVARFYEKIRKSYNNKKSNLYINIVKEIEDINDVLTTLTAMLTQIMLFSKQVEDKVMFFRHIRANEITKVLTLYFTDYNIENCVKLLRLIKADLKAFESIK